MTECFETYHPVTRPPVNPSVRARKTSRDHMQNNLQALQQSKRQAKHKVYNKEEKKIFLSNKLEVKAPARAQSWNNLDNVDLNETQRSLSASNIFALTDPNLSIKLSVPKKQYDKPNTAFAKERATFTAWTQKYYYQLTIGCGNEKCRNIFCKSCAVRKEFNPQMAALVSIELANYNNQYLCIKNEKYQKAALLDEALFVSGNSDAKETQPFLYKFYSTSPFRSLFLPCPLVSSGLNIHKTQSHNELLVSNTNTYIRSVITNTLSNRLKSIASTISSSLSNILKASQVSNKSTKGDEGALKDLRSEEEHGSTKQIDPQYDFPDCCQIEKITTRTRLKSVRLFSKENAVDVDEENVEAIDEFEISVAQELDEGDDMADSADTSEIAADGYALTHLTLEMFETVVENYKQCKDDTFLVNTIRTVFSSWNALNLSFSYEGIKKNACFAINVNTIEVEKMFEAITSLKNSDAYLNVLVDTVEIMLLSQKNHVSNPSDLKPLAIVLEIPLLFEHYSLVLQLASIIASLSKRCEHALAKYISRFREEKFTALLNGFKHVLCGQSTWASPTLKHDTGLLSICKTLQLLYLSNNFNGDKHVIIENSLFYCYEITKKIDFKAEYPVWVKSHENEVSILNFSFLLEPAVKVQVMHIDAITQMREEYQDAIVHQARVQQVQKSWNDFTDSSPLSAEVRSAMCPYLLLEIHRENFVADTLKQLQDKSSDFKKPLKIKYTNSGEQGLDMGGLQKEFFQVLIETVFDPKFSLFTLSEDGSMCWFNAFTMESNVMFEFVGTLMGLAIYNGIILDIHFPMLVYKKLLGYPVGLDDLREVQPTLANGLEQVLQHRGDVENDLCLSFEVSYSLYGTAIKTDLLADGKNTMVTNENREHFVDLYVNAILNQSIEKQFDSFKKGFFQVCSGPTIKLFTPPELELLICGSPQLDFKALESVTEYRDGFTRDHALIKEFWQIVHQFTFKQKQMLLMFVTGSYRVPLKGLGCMSFFIQRNGPDSNNLPTSMTCFNRLLLPEYTSPIKLKRMLLLAIENSKGFGLT